MPSRAAPASLLRRGNQAMELIGFRAAEWPTTLAVSPSHWLLAVATAGADGGSCGGASSRIDLMRLWREEGEQESRRPLKAIASIRDDRSGFLHRRLAWSRGGATSKYPLGLLAGGLDGGAVHIWDPSCLLYEPNIDTDLEEVYGGRRVSWSDDGAYSSCSLQVIMYDLDGKPKSQTVIEEPPEIICEDETRKGASDMRLKLDHLIEAHVVKERPGQVRLPEIKHQDSEDDWDMIQKEDTVVKAQGPEENMWNGLLLKLNHLTGPVLGLAFNHHYPNLLACAAYGEKLKIYYLDNPNEMTYLDWNPVNPGIFASTCDIGETKLWDLRVSSPKSTYAQKLSCSEVHWNPCDPLMFAVSSRDDHEFPVKIWDVRNNRKAIFKFGNAKGVASLSWSVSGLITTTDVDGVVDCWKLDNNKEPFSTAALACESHEARWCDSDTSTATISSHNIEVYKMPAGQCIWPRDPY